MTWTTTCARRSSAARPSTWSATSLDDSPVVPAGSRGLGQRQARLRRHGRRARSIHQATPASTSAAPSAPSEPARSDEANPRDRPTRSGPRADLRPVDASIIAVDIDVVVGSSAPTDVPPRLCATNGGGCGREGCRWVRRYRRATRQNSSRLSRLRYSAVRGSSVPISSRMSTYCCRASSSSLTRGEQRGELGVVLVARRVAGLRLAQPGRGGDRPGALRLRDPLQQGQRLVELLLARRAARPRRRRRPRCRDRARSPCAGSSRRRPRSATPTSSAPRSAATSRRTARRRARGRRRGTRRRPDRCAGRTRPGSTGRGTARDLRVLVDVDLGEHDLAFGGVDRLLDDRTERAARAAPRRPQVDDDGNGGGLVDDVRLERRVGDVDCHATRVEGSIAVRARRVSPVGLATLRIVTSGGEARERPPLRHRRSRARRAPARRDADRVDRRQRRGGGGDRRPRGRVRCPPTRALRRRRCTSTTAPGGRSSRCAAA